MKRKYPPSKSPIAVRAKKSLYSLDFFDDILHKKPPLTFIIRKNKKLRKLSVFYLFFRCLSGSHTKACQVTKEQGQDAHD